MLTADSKNGSQTYFNLWKFFNMVFQVQFSSAQSLSCVRLFATPWIAARQASLSITNSWSPPKLMSIKSVMPSSHLILPFSSCPQSLPASGSFPMSQLFTWGGQSTGVSASVSPSNEHPGLISFRMDWMDLLEVQGTLKSLLQNHSSKAAIFQCSAFFTVQLSHPYITTGKTIALTRWTFVGKVMSLLFNTLSRLVTTFLPRSKHLLISWVQSPSAMISEAKKIKSDTVSTVSPSTSHEVMGPDAMILVFRMLNFKPTFSLSSFTFIQISIANYWYPGRSERVCQIEWFYIPNSCKQLSMANHAVGLDNGMEETIDKKPLSSLARPQRGTQDTMWL